MRRARCVFAIALALTGGCGKPANEPPPQCESVGPTSEKLYRQVSVPGWDDEELARDIATIHSAINVSQGSGAAPSKEFVSAKRARDAERWVDAGQGFREVAKRNGADDRATRQLAEYYFAVALYRLKFYTEAGSIFRAVRAQDGNAKRDDAGRWLTVRWCER
ncbi:hypothetical protein BH09MYX1_BH09MYX1_00780 [soil metagenome]